MLIMYSYLRHGGHLAGDVHHMIFCPDINQWLKLSSIQFLQTLDVQMTSTFSHIFLVSHIVHTCIPPPTGERYAIIPHFRGLEKNQWDFVRVCLTRFIPCFHTFIRKNTCTELDIQVCKSLRKAMFWVPFQRWWWWGWVKWIQEACHKIGHLPLRKNAIAGRHKMLGSVWSR